MGKKIDEALDIAFDDMPTYLHANHSMYMETPTGLYYLTDVNDRYWRVQDTERFNEKGHYMDCSPLVPTTTRATPSRACSTTPPSTPPAPRRTAWKRPTKWLRKRLRSKQVGWLRGRRLTGRAGAKAAERN